MKTNISIKLFFLFLLTLFFPFYLFSQQKKSSKKIFTVVLDAGHGGIDPGAINFGKKDVNKRFDLFVDIAKNIISSGSDEIESIDMRYDNGFTLLLKK